MSKRTTITLDDRDEQTLTTFSNPERPEWQALVQAGTETGITIKPDASEAAILRVLLHVGAIALREQVLAEGYAQLAEVWDEVNDKAETQARRRRYAERVDQVIPS